jgi:hypothetical protein
MRLIIPAAIAALLASTAAQAQEKLCLAPERAAGDAFKQANESRQFRDGPTTNRKALDDWTVATAQCNAGEVLIINYPFTVRFGDAAIARHCDLTKQVVVLPNAAICYVIQPPRQ